MLQVLILVVITQRLRSLLQLLIRLHLHGCMFLRTLFSGNCSNSISYAAPVASDNCSGATVVQTAGLPSGSTFPVRNHPQIHL